MEEAFYNGYTAILGGGCQGLYEEGLKIGTVHHIEGFYFVHSEDVTGASEDSLESALAQWANLRSILSSARK